MALSDLLQPLDYPRQALANTVRGVGNLLSGEAGWEDLLRLLPGIAGGVGMALGGLPAGALAAGAVQGLGKLTGMEAFDAPGAGALVQALDGDPDNPMQEMVGQLATDPLMYMGAAAAMPWWRRMQLMGRGIAPQMLRGSEVASDLMQMRGGRMGTGMPGLAGGVHDPLGALVAAAQPADRSLAALQAAGPLTLEQTHRAIEAEAAMHAAGEQGMRQALAAPIQPAVQPYGLGLEVPEFPGPFPGLPSRRTPPHLPLAGPLPREFPMNLTPQEFGGQLNKLYAIAADAERDAVGGRLLDPMGEIGGRANLWTDILRGEGEASRRMYGRAWPDTGPLGWENAERAMTPEQARLVVARYHQAVAERDLAPYLNLEGEPATGRFSMPWSVAPDNRPQSALYALTNESMSGPRLPWLAPDLSSGHGMDLSTLQNSFAREALGGWEQTIQLSDQAYVQGIGQPVTQLFHGRVPPEEASLILQRLRASGYPVSGPAMGEVYLPHWQNRVRSAGEALRDALLHEDMSTIHQLTGIETLGLGAGHVGPPELSALLGPKRLGEAMPALRSAILGPPTNQRPIMELIQQLINAAPRGI